LTQFKENPKLILNHLFTNTNAQAENHINLDSNSANGALDKNIQKSELASLLVSVNGETKILCNYIKNLKIKRFSEIFYLTYKNFFLLPNSSVFSNQSLSSLERFNNLKFFFQTLGFNQSVYVL
jgi:hypothetical protein